MKLPKRIQVIARGLVIRGNAVLVCAPLDGKYCYLPGGKVEPGESSPTALQREFLEECGESIEVGELAAISEERFAQGDKLKHEVNLVFHVKLPTDAEVRSHAPDIVFRWIAIESVTEENLLPESARKLAMFHVKQPSSIWLGSNSSVG